MGMETLSAVQANVCSSFLWVKHCRCNKHSHRHDSSHQWMRFTRNEHAADKVELPNDTLDISWYYLLSADLNDCVRATNEAKPVPVDLYLIAGAIPAVL